MAAGITKITDVVVPEVFDLYVQQLTEEKSRLVQSGAVARDAKLDGDLAGGGLTFNSPSWKDLDNDADNVSTDVDTSDSSPNKIGSATEIAVRLSRNSSWSSMDLAAALAGSDPMTAIANRVAAYWVRRAQVAFIATMTGVFADNDANDSGDYTNDVKGGGYVAGVTDFSAEAYLDAKVTMGDSMEDLAMIMVHSIVFNRMQKNNLIDFIPDSNGVVNIPTFLGALVIIDDGMPVSTGIHESWLFGGGAMRWGVGLPRVGTEIDRQPAAGDGGGQEVLFNRNEWTFHPVGHAFVAGTIASGGPGNGAGANDLGAATSWNRVFTERKQIKVARLITRES